MKLKPRGCDAWAIVAILVATLPWWIATTCPFIYLDDSAYISANQNVLHGLSLQSIGWAFNTTARGFWFPLTWLSLMADATLFGTGPVGFHFTNVVLHILNTGLVYWLLRRMTAMPFRSLLVALLFAMHPLRVESVAWATERKDVLTVFFGLLTLAAYLEFACHGGGWRYGVTVAFYALALLSKSMLVTLPLLMLVLDFWPLKRVQRVNAGRVLRVLLLEKVPFFIMALAISVITYRIQLGTSAKAYEAVKPLAFRCENAAVAYMLYLRDTVVFNHLSLYYNYAERISAVEWCSAAALLLGVTGAVLIAARSKDQWRPVALGWLWFVGALVPVIGIVQSGNQSRADRFSYFPSIGLFIALVWLWPRRWTIEGWRRTLSVTAAVATVVILMLFMTLQLMLWRDPLKLYLAGLSHTRDNWFLESIAAYEYQQRGDFADAITHYESVVQLAPFMPEPQNNLAGLLVKAGRWDEALVNLRNAHEQAPENVIYKSNYEKVRSYVESSHIPSTERPAGG